MKKISVVILLLLGSCTGTKDPREGNLLDSMVNLSSGEYKRGAKRDRESLNFAVDERQVEQSTAKRLKATQKDLDTERAQLSASLNAMDDDIGHIEEQIANIKSSTQTLKQKKQRVRKRLSKVKHQISKLKSQSNTIDLQKYKDRKQALAQEIESLVRLLAEM